MFESIQQVVPAVAAIRRRWTVQPRAGLVLGSGLGKLARHVTVECALDYSTIPHFPQATAPGHRGRLLCGTLADVPIVAMDGRVHLYEGYRAQQVAFGVRVMQKLGIEVLILANACGGLHPNFQMGDIMVIDDHVNLTFNGPLVGRHNSSSGVPYPDMSRPYDGQFIARAMEAARRNGVIAHRGVYAGVVGPNYETRAEYRMLRRIGGDAVGMSTVCEVIVAAQLGLRVLGLAVVTNVCLPDRRQSTDHGEVLAAAARAQQAVYAIIVGVLTQPLD
jgi:purine-nucleoside phosphorylase